jgi:TM2 domain-containing membrane protein YozV
MKKTVLTFGLISGAVLSVMMTITVAFAEKIGFDQSVIIGYTTMVLAFLLVFFGIRSYRDTIGQGRISFLRALSVGLLIMAIACICYVVTWEIVYFNFMPDFIDKYSIHATQDLRNSGKPPAQIEQEIQEMNRMMTLYKNNFLVNIAFTLVEPLPVGLIMAFISALILRRGRKDLHDGQDEVKGNPINQVNPV